MTDLCKLADIYRVDKCPKYNHTYTPEYHKLLSPLRNKTKLLLEIGIGNIPLMKGYTSSDYKPGASLRMWRDYFPNAQIIGCDILADVQFEEKNIKTFITDQSNVDSLNKLIKNIQVYGSHADIILDDGSHEEEHMVTSFKTLWKLLKPGGLYIIEDIRLIFYDTIRNLYNEFNDAELVQAYKGRGFGDNFVVFHKKTV
jgi:hypothetical protein